MDDINPSYVTCHCPVEFCAKCTKARPPGPTKRSTSIAHFSACALLSYVLTKLHQYGSWLSPKSAHTVLASVRLSVKIKYPSGKHNTKIPQEHTTTGSFGFIFTNTAARRNYYLYLQNQPINIRQKNGNNRSITITVAICARPLNKDCSISRAPLAAMRPPMLGPLNFSQICAKTSGITTQTTNNINKQSNGFIITTPF